MEIDEYSLHACLAWWGCDGVFT